MNCEFNLYKGLYSIHIYSTSSSERTLLESFVKTQHKKDTDIYFSGFSSKSEEDGYYHLSISQKDISKKDLKESSKYYSKEKFSKRIKWFLKELNYLWFKFRLGIPE